MTSDIQKLLALIEQKLEWGPSAGWQGRDFERLSELICGQTKVKLSDSTLKRVWGKVAYPHLPSTTTLDALSQYAGFGDWRMFMIAQQNSIGEKKISQPRRKQNLKGMLLALAAIPLLVLLVFSGWRITGSSRGPYQFSSRRLTRSLPNSVIFTYHVPAIVRDSVFIQETWDPKTRTVVDAQAHTLTAVYYEPGFYHAQLLIGHKVVSTHNLMIPTTGWIGWIADGPVPIYLDTAAYLLRDQMELSAGTVQGKGLDMEVRPPYVRYYNVGNFKGVPVNDFDFSAEVRNGYHSGAAACAFISVVLVTDGDPIIIPVSVSGCVSELTLFSAGKRISGKKADLSGFGADPSKWVKVSCNSTVKTIRYNIDGRLAFETPLPAVETKIVGIGFSFQGTGAARRIALKANGQMVFEAFH